MTDKLVIVQSFDHPVEAHLAKTKLESEGIFCRLHDENIASTDTALRFRFSIYKGIKLVVREADYSAARKLLNLAPSKEEKPSRNMLSFWHFFIVCLLGGTVLAFFENHVTASANTSSYDIVKNLAAEIMRLVTMSTFYSIGLYAPYRLYKRNKLKRE